MERLGEVTKVDGKWLEITFCRPSDCDKCHACMGGAKTTTLRLEGSAAVGDKALVSMPDSTITQASLLAYALPQPSASPPSLTQGRRNQPWRARC